MPYNPKKNGAANYKSWMQLTDAQIAIIEAIEGADNTESPNDERFAQVVHVSNDISSSIVDAEGEQIDNIQTYGTYDTANYQNIDGSSASASTTAFTEETLIRVKSYNGDNWIKRTAGPGTAVTDEGMLLSEGEENTMIVLAGDVISTIGGKLNITPIIL